MSARLQRLDAAAFGTAQEIISDQRWVARYNKAEIVNLPAKKEYEETKGAVLEWYKEYAEQNTGFLFGRNIPRLQWNTRL